MGSFIGPIIAAELFFGKNRENGNLGSVQLVYLLIGGVVLLVAGLFLRTPLPEIRENSTETGLTGDSKPLSQQRHFIYAVIAQFFYVAAQVGVAALFINYCTESGTGIDTSRASYLLSVSLLLFTLGRFAGTALMRRIAPNKLLLVYALINMGLCAVVVWAKGTLPVYALMAVFFFESVMFPTIFALGVKDLGRHTKKGSSFIIMSIVGGALVPYAMGALSEKSTAGAYIIPLCCFAVVAWFGWRGFRVVGK